MKYDLQSAHWWQRYQKEYSGIEFTNIHFHTQFETNLSRNDAVRPHTRVHSRHQSKYGLLLYRRRNNGGSITKSYSCVEYTKIHLHTQFERNPSRNVAVRAHTRIWRGGGGGVTLLNPKYPTGILPRDTIKQSNSNIHAERIKKSIWHESCMSQRINQSPHCSINGDNRVHRNINTYLNFLNICTWYIHVLLHFIYPCVYCFSFMLFLGDSYKNNSSYFKSASTTGFSSYVFWRSVFLKGITKLHDMLPNSQWVPLNPSA